MFNLFDEKPELEVIKAKFFKAKMGRWKIKFNKKNQGTKTFTSSC